MTDKLKPTETKAQRAERLKRAKNAWEHLDEIRAFARDGYASIPPEWFSTYFRSWGIYSQGDGHGVIGGSGGEGKSVPFFMVRIRIPNGILTSHQVREIADLAKARTLIQRTVEQLSEPVYLQADSFRSVIKSASERDGYVGAGTLRTRST